MKHRIFKLITIVFIFIQIFTPVWKYIPLSGSSILAIFFVTTILLFPNLLFCRSLVLLSIYTLITFVFYLRGNAFFNEINTVVIPFLTISPGLLITEYTLKFRSINYVKASVYTIVFALLIMTLVSIPSVLVNPNIIRSASIYGARSLDNADYYIVIGYGTIHGLVVLFAPLAFLTKRYYSINKGVSVFWLLVILVLLTIVFLSNATTALIISVLFLGAGFLINYTNLSRKNMIKLVLTIGLVLLIFNKYTLVKFLDYTQTFVAENGSNFYKIKDIKTYLMYDKTEGSILSREYHYEDSIKLFLESPIFGTSNPENIGLHSYFIDRLAVLGIVLIIPLILLYVVHVRFVYKSLLKTKVVFALSCLCYLIMLFLKNDFGTGTFLFALGILPLLCIYIDHLLVKPEIVNR